MLKWDMIEEDLIIIAVVLLRVHNNFSMAIRRFVCVIFDYLIKDAFPSKKRFLFN